MSTTEECFWWEKSIPKCCFGWEHSKLANLKPSLVQIQNPHFKIFSLLVVAHTNFSPIKHSTHNQNPPASKPQKGKGKRAKTYPIHRNEWCVSLSEAALSWICKVWVLKGRESPHSVELQNQTATTKTNGTSDTERK